MRMSLSMDLLPLYQSLDYEQLLHALGFLECINGIKKMKFQ